MPRAAAVAAGSADTARAAVTVLREGGGAVDAALAAEAPGVVVTGAAHRGRGLPACIRQGQEAAATVRARLDNAAPAR